MRDAHLRAALKNWLVCQGLIDSRTRVIDELGLRHGKARVDVAVLDGHIHGFELKTDQDSLARLPVQRRIYEEVLDRITLVVAERHAVRAKSLIAPWWGLLVAKPIDQAMDFVVLQKALPNPSQKAEALAKLLWRLEALSLLKERDLDKGVARATRRLIYRKVAENIPLKRLRHYVRDRLQSREAWRVAAPPT
jgi:hypothetical protein